MEDLVFRLVYDALAILITVVVAMLIGLLKKKLGVEGLKKVQEELTAKQELALLAVKAVEQLWGGVLHGDEKVEKATEIISEQATKIGLNISSEEIRTLIEWAVRTMKDELGEEWANATKATA
ncbi:phage holin [Thermoanaerobacterium sp. DL9XJH110]|uniref:phage holin n=1 Tax=Thermoanaerobacterium sp. DL9XJH110 TaxID=3386643 RepID=UPI003BB66D3C